MWNLYSKQHLYIQGPVRFGSIDFITLKLKSIQIEFFFCFSGLDFSFNFFLFSWYNWFFLFFCSLRSDKLTWGLNWSKLKKKYKKIKYSSNPIKNSNWPTGLINLKLAETKLDLQHWWHFLKRKILNTISFWFFFKKQINPN